MFGLPKILEDFFNIIDKEIKPLSAHKIDSEIQKTIKEIYGDIKELEIAVLAEAMAFKFCEEYTNENTGWETYYGPLMVFPNENGQVYESPNIKRISPEIIDH